MPYDHTETEAQGMHAASLLLKKTMPKNKREAKKLMKEKEIIRLHHVEGMKSCYIAKRMKVSAEEVYKIVRGYNSRVKKY